MSCNSDVSSKEETTKIDPFFGPQMGLFFFVWFHASVSSPGEEKPLKNDFGAKQPYAETGAVIPWTAHENYGQLRALF